MSPPVPPQTERSSLHTWVRSGVELIRGSMETVNIKYTRPPPPRIRRAATYTADTICARRTRTNVGIRQGDVKRVQAGNETFRPEIPGSCRRVRIVKTTEIDFPFSIPGTHVIGGRVFRCWLFTDPEYGRHNLTLPRITSVSRSWPSRNSPPRCSVRSTPQ